MADINNDNQSAQPESAANHSNSAKGYPCKDWTINVAVPGDWTQRQDRAELQAQDVKSRDELVDLVADWIQNVHGILTLAFNYLRKQPWTADQTETASAPDGERPPYDPDQHRVFNGLSIRSKLDILKTLFRRRSQDSDYLEGFECDLQRFAEIEATCMPVLERFCLNPNKVWLRELGGVLDALVQAVHDYDESLRAEHPDCPKFVDVVYNRR